jgi:hypothetical protein
MRSIPRLLILSAIFALTLAARADNVSFTLILNSGPNLPPREALFSLPQTTIPDHFNITGSDYLMEFFNVQVINTESNGTSFTDLETVTFLSSDGDVITNLIDIHTEMNVFSGSPANPTFILGTYPDRERADGSEVTITAVPEPSAFALLATGTLGIIGLAKRKLLKAD